MRKCFFSFLTWILLIPTLFCFNGFSQTDCIVARYMLDGNAIDSSGNGNNGTLYGTTLTTDHDNNANSALYFNGTSDKVVLPDDFDFPERTISLWMKTDTFPVGGKWTYDSDHASILYGHTQIYVEKYNGTNDISFSIGTNFYRYTNAFANTWYHAVVSVHSAYVKFYVNGVMVDSIANNSFAHSMDGDNVAKIGTTRKDDRFFAGSIDEVKIFDCGLSDDEILQLYTSVKDNFSNNPNIIQLFPNPASDEISVIYSSDKKIKYSMIRVFNHNGQQIIQKRVKHQTTQIDISNLPAGIYLLRFEYDNEFAVKKFIKE